MFVIVAEAWVLTQSDLIEGGLGLESRGDVFGLVFVRCAASKIRVEPNSHKVVAAGNVLDFEDDSPLDALVHVFIRPEHA